MIRPTIRINTGTEIIDREMNDAEYEQYLIDIANYESRLIADQEKAAAKASLLDRLGITEEEAKLLLS